MVGFLSGSITASAAFLLSLSSSSVPNVDPSELSPQQSPSERVVSVSAEKYNNLLNWVNSTFPTSYVSPSICLAPSEYGGYGAFATDDIEEDTLLFSIPRSACITSSVALNDDDCGKTFQALIKKAGPGSETVAMAGYLAKEYLIHLEGKQTFFGPYFDTLPWERGFNGQEHVLFWSKEDVLLKLKDTMCFAESKALREEVKLATKVLNSIIGPSILSARSSDVSEDEEDSSFSMPQFLSWMKPNSKPTVSSPVPGVREAVIGAFVILLTRSFSDEFQPKIDMDDDSVTPAIAERLVPILDMLNHNSDPSIRFNTNSDGGVDVVSRRDIKTGEEIYNQYREEEEMKMPKHRFFTRFGFVPGIDEGVDELLEEKSNVFFAKRQEV